MFYKPKDLSKNRYLEQIENAILQQPAMALDSSYVDDLSVQMYRSKMHDNTMFGTDSLAFDIQRWVFRSKFWDKFEFLIFFSGAGTMDFQVSSFSDTNLKSIWFF